MQRRPPPDKTKDTEGVTVGRSPLSQRARNISAPPPPRSPTPSEIDALEDDREDQADFSSPVAAVTAVTAWLNGEDEEVSYAKKDK